MKKENEAKKKSTATAKKERIRVLVADDHSVVREGLVSLIKRKADMMVVGEASNGREAVDLWKEHRPDVTLLDLRMPELDGVGTIKEIRELDEAAHIIVLIRRRARVFSRALKRRTSLSLRPAREALRIAFC